MANITRYSAFVSPFWSVLWRVPFSEQRNNIYCEDVWSCVLNAAMQQSPGDWSHLFGPWLFSQKLIKMGSPRFMPPPPLSLHLLHLCVITVRVGSQGARAQPQWGRGGGWWATALMETVSMKWPSGSDASWACFTLAWAYGWGCGRVGSLSNEGGSVERDKPGCYCMFCLVPRPCASEIGGWAVNRNCIFFSFRGSPWTKACKSG